MRDKVLGLVAAATLLTSVGVASAKGPVTLTDGQLDKVTAGDAASQTAFLVGVSTDELNRLLTISNFTVGLLNGFSVAPSPTAVNGISLVPPSTATLPTATLPMAPLPIITP